MTALTTAPDVHFDPSMDRAAFAAAAQSYATGVALVTTDRGEGPMGIVAHGFAAISSAPPMVMWALPRQSHRFSHFADARRFVVHILTDAQKRIVEDIDGSKTAFGGFDWSNSQAGVPLIHDVAACFECNLEARHDAGDHALILGRVIRAHHQGGVPLVTHDGRYGSFAERISGS